MQRIPSIMSKFIFSVCLRNCGILQWSSFSISISIPKIITITISIAITIILKVRACSNTYPITNNILIMLFCSSFVSASASIPILILILNWLRIFADDQIHNFEVFTSFWHDDHFPTSKFALILPNFLHFSDLFRQFLFALPVIIVVNDKSNHQWCQHSLRHLSFHP